MKEIIVNSQEELDALPIDFDGRIIIKFGTPYNRAIVNWRFKYRVEAWGNSSVVAWDSASVEASGNSQVRDSTRSHKITTTANARIVYDPRNIDEYCEHYQIERNGDTVKLFKAVRKEDGKYVSDRNSSFEYIIGCEAVADKLTTDTSEDCGHGIHIAYKDWCVNYGRGWKDLAILEVEAEASGIVVPVPGCGKVRAERVKVIREVPLEECGLLGTILAKWRDKDGA